MHCRHCNRHPKQGRERGAALIVAMLVFALATALVVAMKSDFERFFQRSANILLDEQAQAYLRGAEELAALVLIRDYDEDKAEGLRKQFAGEFERIEGRLEKVRETLQNAKVKAKLDEIFKGADLFLN